MDINEQLTKLLSSPESVEKLKEAAGQLFGEETPPNPEPKQNTGFSLPEGLLGNIGNISSIMKLISLMQDRKDDDRIKLLYAIKPHLSSNRAKRVDKAISLLRVASIVPVLKQEGLLDGLLGGDFL